MLTQERFLKRLIDLGVQVNEGATEYLEGCRGKSPAQILSLLFGASRAVADAKGQDASRKALVRECQLEWVLGGLSAYLFIVGKAPPVRPAAHTYLVAARILCFAPPEAAPDCLVAEERLAYPGLAARIRETLASRDRYYSDAVHRALLLELDQAPVVCPCGRGDATDLLPAPPSGLAGVCGLCFFDASEDQAGTAHGLIAALPHDGVPLQARYDALKAQGGGP